MSDVHGNQKLTPTDGRTGVLNPALLDRFNTEPRAQQADAAPIAASAG